MQRTTIMLPEELKAMAEAKARRSDRSLGQLIRDALEKELKRPEKGGKTDSIFSDLETFDEGGPEDLAQNHDDYLYGGKPL